MKIILLGAPGAGKGTQAEIISQKLGIPTISTGNILRAAVKAGTPIGLEAKRYMDAGKLVPDEVIIGIIQERLAQAEALDAHGIRFDAVLSLEIADEVIAARLTGRRTCHACGATYHVVTAPPKAEGVCDKCGGALEQRKDDMPETVQHRLQVYHTETEPLKDFYAAKGVLKRVPDLGGIEETNAHIMELLGK